MKTRSIGNILRGNRRRLNRVSETKAVLASRMLLGSLSTYVVKDACWERKKNEKSFQKVTLLGQCGREIRGT